MPHCSRSSAPDDAARSARPRDAWFFHFFPPSPPIAGPADHHEYEMRHLDTSRISRGGDPTPSSIFESPRARTICMHRHPGVDNRYGNHVSHPAVAPMYTRASMENHTPRPAARVNSDEKSRRNIRAGSRRLEDRSVSRIRDPARSIRRRYLREWPRRRIFLPPWSRAERCREIAESIFAGLSVWVRESVGNW